MTVEEVRQYIAANTPDPAIALAQAQAESGWQARFIFGPDKSSAGAAGVFQFMPATWGQYGGGASIWDPVAQTHARNSYMADLLGMFGGDYAKALAGYNWGQGRVQKAVQQFGSNWAAHIPAETQGYITKILGSGAVNFRKLLRKPPKEQTTGKKSRKETKP